MQTNHPFFKLILLVFLISSGDTVSAQNSKTDSLKKVVQIAKDTTKIKALNQLAMSIYYDNSDSALYLTDQAYLEAKNINYLNGMSYAMYAKFTIHVIRGEFYKAINYEKERILFLEKHKDNSKLFGAYRNLGWAMRLIGNSSEAIKAYDKSISIISKQEQYRHLVFRILIDKATLLKDMGQYIKAHETYTQALKEMEAVKNKEAIPVDIKTALYHLAELYNEIGDIETSQTYYKKADQISFNFGNELDNIEAEASWKFTGFLDAKKFDSAFHYKKKLDEIYSKQPHFRDTIVQKNLAMGGYAENGKLYAGLNQCDSAIGQLVKAQQYFKDRKIGYWVRVTSFPLASCYFKNGDYSKAKQYCTDFITQAESSQSGLDLRDGYQLLSQVYEKIGDKDNANLYYRKYAELKDQIKTDEFKQKLQLYKVEEREKQKQSSIDQLKKEKRWLTSGIILLAISLASFFSFIWVQRKYNAKKRLLKEKEIELKQAEDERRIASLEMMALRSQMNPHFIFNCLNSINRFVLRNDNEAASNYLTKFSKVMRMVLENSKQALIPLEEEVKCLELYIQMEQFRCRNSFRYYVKYHDGVNVSEAMIAPLLLQPFVENAIWHGLSPKEGEGKLGIEFLQKEETLYCVILDNGIGRKKASELKSQLAEHHKSMGLQITNERLAAMGINHSIESPVQIEDLHDENGWPAGTKVTIRIFSLPVFEELKPSLNL